MLAETSLKRKRCAIEIKIKGTSQWRSQGHILGGKKGVTRGGGGNNCSQGEGKRESGP